MLLRIIFPARRTNNEAKPTLLTHSAAISARPTDTELFALVRKSSNYIHHPSFRFQCRALNCIHLFKHISNNIRPLSHKHRTNRTNTTQEGGCGRAAAGRPILVLFVRLFFCIWHFGILFSARIAITIFGLLEYFWLPLSC